VVFEAQQAGRRALALPEIAGGIDGDADRGEAEQNGEDRAERKSMASGLDMTLA
jgi:hypothetical protein